MKRLLFPITILIMLGSLIFLIVSKSKKNDDTWTMDTRFENYLNIYVAIAFFDDITLVDAYNGKTLFVKKGESIGGYLRISPLEGQSLKQYLIQANYGGVSTGYYNVEKSKIQSVTQVSS
jgi:hypothetical protein